MSSPAHYRVMFGGSVEAGAPLPPDLATESAGALQALVDALIALARAGSVRGDDPMMMARFVWAVVHGVAMLAIDGRLHTKVEVDALAHYAVERLWNGIDARRT